MSAESASPIVVVGIACRVPGADDVNAFADLLYNGRTGYGELPPERCDRALYFDPQKGKTGTAYTTLGGIVPERPLNRDLCSLTPQAEKLFDTAHVQFAEVAATAWKNATLSPGDSRLSRTGVYVGHSGGTKSGGGLSLGTQIEEALSFVDDIDAFRRLPEAMRQDMMRDVATAIRRNRPFRQKNASPSFHAYQAAALSARVLGLTGPRSVIDAACASSLVALAQAIMAIRAGRIDSAIVGGATYNNVDNLILFSHSQACTAIDSRPFDDGASGLVSSEGYVAVVVTTQATANSLQLPVLGVIRGVGMASDGKGRSLWAPRMEGQILALQRAYENGAPLDIDYMEAHATSTQLGDATELETLRQLSQDPQARTGPHKLLLGSVKSNIGHTLEAAGLIGMVKVLIAMQRGQIPPSLRFENPNHNYDWTTAPVRVVSQTTAWPVSTNSSRGRRAAVSAFGIGGLNAHVVVEQPGAGQTLAVKAGCESAFGQSPALDPIAIVGRGVVVAGALNVSEFQTALRSSESAIREVPSERWRSHIGVSPGCAAETYHTPHCRGGFITDFSFDGARYRIPPKQVQQANPVQMMLIDAVSQAIADTGGKDFPVDRQRVGVVIGTIFGGEFGDQLQVGMRLPEICQLMSEALVKRGLSQAASQAAVNEYRTTVLKNRPALLDETGSFTASTLASRVAKTFDLMGGACALDSDDASGLAALAVAVDQLRLRLCDMIVCGSAQRSMSLAAFEALDMSGRLVRSGSTDDIPDDCRQVIPGEGVVALALCRLSDAKRLNLPVYGILGDVSQKGSPAATPVTTVSDFHMAETCLDRADAEIVRRIGYLSGAHSLIRIVAETLTSQSNITESIPISSRTSDGLVMQVQFQLNENIPQPPTVARPPQLRQESLSPQNAQVSSMMTTSTLYSGRPYRCVRFGASTSETMLRLLRDGLSHADAICGSQESQRVRRQDGAGEQGADFSTADQYRAVILAADPQQLRDRLAAAIKAAESGRFRAILDRERVVLWQTANETARVAWLFPGQGSHYTEKPAVFAARECARHTLNEVDRLFEASNLPRLSTAFDNAAIRPGADVWWAQAWVLGVSAALIEVLKSERLRPDAVLGHSFGEFTASLASGVTTLPQTIELARHRANSVMSHMRTAGGLLSVRAAVHEVDAILKSAALPVYVTHLNSPRQTVIAGSGEGIAAAKILLDRQGLAAMSISVPAPFHTPLLGDAEIAFERMSSGVPMRPPTTGFLSATCVQYLAEPSGIRHSLVRQLTQPVMYMPSIQRMLGEGFRVFLEVGPNDVLTRMNRDIVDGQAICLSLDVPGQNFDERMQFVRAVLECVANEASAVQQTSLSVTDRSTATNAAVAATAVTNAIFDVTRTRRSTRKTNGGAEESSATASETASAFAVPSKAMTGPVAGAVTSPPPLQATENSKAVSDQQLRGYVRDLVVELTGYSPDIIDFEADLEADLGVDSIKKAQILGELGEWLGLTVRPDSLRLDSVKTLNDAVRVAVRLASEASSSTENEDNSSGIHSDRNHQATGLPTYTVASMAPASTPAPSKSPAEISLPGAAHRRLPPNDQLDTLLIDYVVDQTGYSRDIVDVDADLEADLGLDSIKLAQLIGEMREQFQLESLTLESIAQARFRTLRGIREFLLSHDKGTSADPETSTDSDEFSPRQSGNGVHSVSESFSGSTESIGNSRPAFSVESHGLNGHAGSSLVTAKSWEPLGSHDPFTHNSNGYAAAHSAGSTSVAIRGTEPIEPTDAAWTAWLQELNSVSQDASAALQSGIIQGQIHQHQIRAVLRALISLPASTVPSHHWSASESLHLKGLATGAGVSETSIRVAAAIVRERSGVMTPTSSNPACTTEFVEIDANDSQNPAQSEQTHRYALRVVPAPRRSGMPLNPELHGAALILGVNPLSESLAEKIRQLGQKAIVLDTSVPIGQIENSLNELWQHTATPHLFLTMAFDVDSARTLQESEWRRRRPAALESPFRICQLWMQKTIDASLMEKASVVSVTQLGGDFGFSGKHVRCVEAIGGLVKAMLIEAWMRGFRTTPMKIVDVTEGMKPQDIVSGVLQELAVPSYDMEIALRSGPQPHAPERYSVQAMAAPLDSARSAMQHGMTNRVTRGGTWIVSGGGRGITAVIAMTLAKKYDLKLHLLGTAPVPNLSDEFVRMVAQDRSGVRRSIMNDASARGENPVEAWRNAEKAIEVDATLRECRKQNVKATYYCCDVSDFTEVADIVGQIRRTGGPIQGVIHGAGAGQDARFDRKRPDKVEKCLRAKIDGTFALMQATRQDPLQWFVTFGSISGRFGANGHTDYSLANDMMAKIVDRYRTERPEVRSLTFHWHAWGDIGMATKPEAKLALEMIDMEFMPARDGIAHFMNELEYGGEEPEVLITDESYFRKFFPAERLSVSSTKSGSLPVPLIPGTVTQHGDGVCSSVITLNPVTDKFLSQHRVQSRPTLPFVVALELMAEAVRVRTGTGDAGICLRARAMQAIRFSTEDPLAITVQTRPTPQGGIECRLLADVRRRDGRMVEEDREYFRAEFLPRDKALSASTSAQRFEKPANVSWKKIEYVSPEGLIYHGPELQELREITDDGTTIFGRIAASAAVQLFGGTRARGFTVPCATMDACLYAIGYAAWQRHQKPSLPVEFEHIEFGRLPDPGEPCLVRIQQTHLSDSGAIWNFQLQGHNGDRLLTVSGYRIGWLKTS
jgi:acyl transferase domain-containing protein